jgi:Ca2+-binding EF-hand superfamily protein
MKHTLATVLALGLAVSSALALAQDYGERGEKKTQPPQERTRGEQRGDEMKSSEPEQKMKDAEKERRMKGSEKEQMRGSEGEQMMKGSERGPSSGAEEDEAARRRDAQRGRDTKRNGQKKVSTMTRFEVFDRNGDRQISKQELRTGIGPLFDDWDYDANDELVDLEIVHGMFNAWDVDGDDEIDEVEFENGKTMWLPDDTSVRYGDFDLDGRPEVTLTEFVTTIRTSDMSLYNLDADAPLTSYELAEAMLAVYDDDRDGALSREEWPLG